MAHLNLLRRESGGNEHLFLFHAFCYFCGIRIIRKMRISDEGGTTYLFRRCKNGRKPYGEHIPIQGWQIQFYIHETMEWLTKDCDRLADVFPEITLRGKRFHSPGYAMAGMTFQQHQLAQRYMGEYSRIGNRLAGLYHKIREGGTGIKASEVKSLLEQREEARCSLMATVFTPEVKVSSKLVDGKQVVYDPPMTDFIFSTDQVERESSRFHDFPEHKSDAVIQHFCGVMLHYKKIYPLLFKSEENLKKTDFIRVEESTLNALQGKLQFGNYQTIYDSNAPFILGQLHTIMQEAKSIEESNRKMKQRSRK